MPDSFENMDKYIQKLLEIQEQKEEDKITEQQMRDIAKDMGLSDDNWQEVLDYAAEHFTRGNGYAKYKNWSDAIKEYEQSKAIRPNSVQLLYALATSHYQRWVQKGAELDKEAAQKYALKCLRLDPKFDEAFKLITQLKTKRWLGLDTKQWLWVSVAGLVTTLFIGFLLYPNSSNQDFVQQTPLNQIRSNQIITTEERQVSTQLKKLATVTHSGTPIVLMGNSKQVKFEVDDQSFSSYSNSANYSIKGYFIYPKHNISNIKIKVKLYNTAGNLINEKIDDALKKNYHPVARAGDYIPFHLSIYGSYIHKPPLAKVVLEILVEEMETPPSSYEPSDPVNVAYDPKRPKNVQLTVSERKNLQSYSKYSKAINQKNTFEITNIGNVNLKRLKGRVDWYKKDGTKYSSSSKELLYNFLPNLKRNQTRVVRFEGSAKGIRPEEVDFYQLVITKIDY